MLYKPKNYRDVNLQEGTHFPSAIRQRNNASYWYWQRALFQRLCSVFEWELPEAWSDDAKNFFLFCLYRNGFVCVWDSPKFGFTVQPCTLKGLGWYYQPLKAIISNPLWRGELEIGKECELIRLTPDYCGVWDIVDRFAGKLSELDCDVDMSLLNNKVPFAVAVRNKSAGHIVRKALDLIYRGEPAVVADYRLLKDKTDDEEALHILDRDMSKSYITDKLLADQRSIINEFLTEVGINNTPFEKKERLLTDEVNSNNTETLARATTWLDCISRSIDDIKKLYPDVRLSCKFRTFEEGGADNVISEVDD